MTTKIKNLVLIDDEEIFLASLKDAFVNLGYNVSIFDDKNECKNAIDHILLNNVDLIFVDEDMPSITGREFGKKLMTLEKINHIPIIMLTANSDIDYALEAITECGFDYFYSKSGFISELNKKIEFILTIPSVKNKFEIRNLDYRIKKINTDYNNTIREKFLSTPIYEILTSPKKEDFYQERLNRLLIQNKIVKLNNLPLCRRDNLALSIDFIESNKISNENINEELKVQLLDYINSKKAKSSLGKVRAKYNKYFQLFKDGKYTKDGLLTIRLIIENKDKLDSLIHFTKQKMFNNASFGTFIDEIIIDMESKKEV